jgi:hypothetical protein
VRGLGRQAELLRTGIRTLGGALAGVATVGGLTALVDRSISGRRLARQSGWPFLRRVRQAEDRSAFRSRSICSIVFDGSTEQSKVWGKP